MAIVTRPGSLAQTYKAPIGAVGVVIREDARADVTLAPTITSGTGAPSETEPKGSLYCRRNVPDADNAIYVSNGAGSWNALEAGGSSLTIADTFAITWGDGGDFIVTANGTDAVVSGGGDLVFADSYVLAMGTGKDMTLASDGTDCIMDGAGDLVLSDSYVLALGAGKDVTLTPDGTDVVVAGAGNLLVGVDYFVRDTFTIGFGTAGGDVVMTADGTNVVVTGTGIMSTADSVHRIHATADPTKLLYYDLTGITTGNSRVITSADGNMNLNAIPAAIADPGHAGAMAVDRSGVCPLTIGSAGAETSTLAIPTFIGQEITITADVIGTGTRAVTAASAINVAGNTVMTFDTARDTITLKAIQLAGVLAWEATFNAAVALS